MIKSSKNCKKSYKFAYLGTNIEKKLQKYQYLQDLAKKGKDKLQ
jgi:hypothetical protein